MPRLPRLLLAFLVPGLAAPLPAPAAEKPAARLTVKPQLCVTDKDATVCSMTFNIRWKSETTAEYCLNDSEKSVPLRCWETASAGTHSEKREVSEAFVYWLGAPGGAQRVAEVKIEVLRLDSADRRRERRTRHVWDVL